MPRAKSCENSLGRDLRIKGLAEDGCHRLDVVLHGVLASRKVEAGRLEEGDRSDEVRLVLGGQECGVGAERVGNEVAALCPAQSIEHAARVPVGVVGDAVAGEEEPVAPPALLLAVATQSAPASPAPWMKTSVYAHPMMLAHARCEMRAI